YRDPVASRQPERAESIGHPSGFFVDFGECDRTCGAVLAFPEAGDTIAFRPTVQAIVGDVETSAGEPLCPLHAAAGVQHLLVRLKPLHAHLAHHLVPETLRILPGKK